MSPSRGINRSLLRSFICEPGVRNKYSRKFQNFGRGRREKVIPDSRYFFVAHMLGILRSYMNWAPAPKWIIECRNCAARFIHSEVGKDRRVIAYLYPTEPKFSLHGE